MAGAAAMGVSGLIVSPVVDARCDAKSELPAPSSYGLEGVGGVARTRGYSERGAGLDANRSRGRESTLSRRTAPRRSPQVRNSLTRPALIEEDRQSDPGR